MQGIRIQLRYLGFGSSGYLPVLPGEPVFDPTSRRIGVGIGGLSAIWFPRATSDGNLEFDTGQGLKDTDGNYFLKFKATGIEWSVNNEVILETIDDGIAVRSSVMMRNEAGANVVVMGYGHYMALMAMLFNLKSLLRDILDDTAVEADIDALFTPSESIDLTTLAPAFPEAPSL